MGVAASVRVSLAGEAMERFSAVEKAVALGITQWENLSPEFKAVMDDVVAGLTQAAEFNEEAEEDEPRGGDENAMASLHH
mmetsp:Transcript_45372/g.102484  ORF Transcript_45372/g.102484 Transcript_45372/m.102484 type:complete len:80 (-) Transcript_45372:1203-1442(-)